MKIKFIVFIFLIVTGVFGNNHISINFPYLKQDSVLKNDLLYFSIKEKRPEDKLYLYYIKDDKKVKIPPFFITSANKTNVSGLIWVDVLKQPIFSTGTITIFFELLAPSNEVRGIHKQNIKVNMVNEIPNLSDAFIDFYSKLLYNLCRGKEYYWKTKNEPHVSQLKKTSQTHSELGISCKISNMFIEIDKQLEKQVLAILKDINKEKKNVLEEDDDILALTWNRILKTNIIANISKKRQKFITELEQRKSCVLWDMFYPLYVTMYLDCGELDNARNKLKLVTNPDAKKTLSSLLEKYYNEDGIIKKKRKAVPSIKNINAFIVMLKNSAISIDDKHSQIIKFMKCHKVQLSEDDLLKCFSALLKTYNMGTAVIFCHYYIYKNNNDLENNKILKKYENAVVNFYLNKDKELTQEIIKIKGKSFFVSTYSSVRTIPLYSLSEVIKTKQHAGDTFYDFFEQELLKSDKEKNILYPFKRQYPELFEAIRVILTKRTKN